YVALIAVVAFALAIFIGGGNDVLSTVLWVVLFGDIVLGIPVACAIAILKYRLYELDIVIKKTVVFAVLAAFVTLVFVAVVVGLGAKKAGVWMRVGSDVRLLAYWPPVEGAGATAVEPIGAVEA